jgi:hypothetical protein
MNGYNKGSNNGRWKGGKYQQCGYTLVRIDGGYTQEHVLIFEKYHNCCMLRWGHVHHINHIRDDNRIENLQGLTVSQHNRIHHKKDMTNRSCELCGGQTTFSNGKYNWMKTTNGFVCKKCYNHIHYLAKRGGK